WRVAQSAPVQPISNRTSGSKMNHQEFVEGYKNGTLKAFMPPATAENYLKQRPWPPLFTLPVLGAGVGLVLIGWFITGIIVFLLGYFVPRMIKRNAVNILMYQALHDANVYVDLREAGVLEVYE